MTMQLPMGASIDGITGQPSTPGELQINPGRGQEASDVGLASASASPSRGSAGWPTSPAMQPPAASQTSLDSAAGMPGAADPVVGIGSAGATLAPGRGALGESEEHIQAMSPVHSGVHHDAVRQEAFSKGSQAQGWQQQQKGGKGGFTGKAGRQAQGANDNGEGEYAGSERSVPSRATIEQPDAKPKIGFKAKAKASAGADLRDFGGRQGPFANKPRREQIGQGAASRGSAGPNDSSSFEEAPARDRSFDRQPLGGKGPQGVSAYKQGQQAAAQTGNAASGMSAYAMKMQKAQGNTGSTASAAVNNHPSRGKPGLARASTTGSLQAKIRALAGGAGAESEDEFADDLLSM